MSAGPPGVGGGKNKFVLSLCRSALAASCYKNRARRGFSVLVRRSFSATALRKKPLITDRSILSGLVRIIAVSPVYPGDVFKLYLLSPGPIWWPTSLPEC
jgi:hypothetical protein